MSIRFGKIKREEEHQISLDDLLKYPIWICRDDLTESNPGWGCYFPVLSSGPDLTREMAEQDPVILCRVPGRKVYARASYDSKCRYIIGIFFWRRSKWMDLWDAKLPRPLTLVAVPKILGQAEVPFYVLSKKDIAAPRIGGIIHRWDLQSDRGAVLSEDLRIIRRKQPKRRDDAKAGKRAAQRAKTESAGIKLGKPKHFNKITLK